ncbi:MAG TPA: nitroreductase family deazaflavin-dependent oxidoreductase [Acidimicrobiia bacterium]|nr:nitroreductase family deazaflavin-dependent oxidoreductase [Acidimicrobiia bacterium]
MTEGNNFNQQMIEQFRANGNRLEFGPTSLLLLTTTGAKTGVERVTPLAAFDADGTLFVIASYAGAPANPAWFRNLVAQPTVTVEFGGEKFTATAHVAPPDERDRLFEYAVERVAQFGEYQAKTKRTIPIVTLERVS